MNNAKNARLARHLLHQNGISTRFDCCGQVPSNDGIYLLDGDGVGDIVVKVCDRCDSWSWDVFAETEEGIQALIERVEAIQAAADDPREAGGGSRSRVTPAVVGDPWDPKAARKRRRLRGKGRRT